MADNYIEKQFEQYQARKEAWLKGCLPGKKKQGKRKAGLKKGGSPLSRQLK